MAQAVFNPFFKAAAEAVYVRTSVERTYKWPKLRFICLFFQCSSRSDRQAVFKAAVFMYIFYVVGFFCCRQKF